MKRIIPLFLLKGDRLVKGTNFGNYVNVGNPMSQAMIYDAQGADEITVVDIEASQEGKSIDPGIINKMIRECRLPIAAGGGINTIEKARACFKAGADKILLNTAAVLKPKLISQLAREFGTQSVLISIDVRRHGHEYEVYIESGKTKSHVSLKDLIRRSIEYGAGEIIITSIDKEGTLSGLDMNLYQQYEKYVTVPLIASGGAGCYDDMVSLFNKTSVDACAIGKMLFLRDYDIVRIKSYLRGRKIPLRNA